MHTKSFFCNSIVVLLFTSRIGAQVQQSGWLASFNTIGVNKKFSIHFDAQWRSTDNIKSMQTLLLRGGVNYKAGKNITVTGGYAFISNRKTISGVSGYAPENRLWEQLVINQKIKKISIAHRLRIEQRFISQSAVVNNELVNEGSVNAGRLRYFARSIVPLTRDKNFFRGYFAALQNEVFINIGNRAAVNGKYFDQNRLYLAIGYKCNSKLSFDFGYMNQYISGRGDSFTNNHIVQLATYTSL